VVTLADIVRGEGVQYLQEARFVTFEQNKALYDITRCRTAGMGSIAVPCDQCHIEYWLFRSCRNRSCPQCQGEARAKWLEARRMEILPVPYLHVVFSTPAELNVLARYCPEPFYDAVIRASGQALVDVGRSELHAQLGCQTHLQTWSQSMAQHVHTHCVVPCGGFSEDGSRWISFESDDLPAEALMGRFRALVCKSIRRAAQQGKLDRLPATVSVEKLLAAVQSKPWKIYAKPPFGGVEKLLEYLARYTYRVAITNDRIESYEHRQVTFRWRDYRDRKEKPCALEGQEFVRRFVTHVPPCGFVRIRSYGFMGNRNRKQNIERARQLIGKAATPKVREAFKSRRLCPACSGRDERTLHVAPRPDVAPQFEFSVRPPPIEPVAA
jgi:putative transposase/transposase-like zinc-binding protein